MKINAHLSFIIAAPQYAIEFIILKINTYTVITQKILIPNSHWNEINNDISILYITLNWLQINLLMNI